MRITEETINHNAMRLVDEVTECIWENTPESAVKEEAYIRGVLDLAEELKKVLKV